MIGAVLAAVALLAASGDASFALHRLVTDRADPKLAHIDGLNLSRAWMLEGIAHGLGPDTSRTAGHARGTPAPPLRTRR